MARFNYQTYVFDLDGTLLDTLGDLAASVNFALRTHHMPLRSLDEVRMMVGNGVRLLMERAVPAGTSPELQKAALDTFRQYYLEHSLDTTRPYDGVPQMLRELRRCGRHTAVVSNKFDAATKELCRHFFPDTIEVAIGEHEAEGIRKKPAPDTVVEAMRQLGVAPATTVYVGDSDVDVATAKNSGIPCISVLWGFRDREFLVSHGAQRFVSRPEELLSFL